MELGWSALVLLMLAAIAAWFWQDSLATRERANAAAMEACSRLSLQFLDGTVAFARLQFVRGANSAFTLRRTYVFDYTANSIERRQGFVVLTGRRVDSVGYAQDEQARAAPAAAAPPSRAIDVQQLLPSAKILSLEQWRARQQSQTGDSENVRHNGTQGSE